MGFAALYPSYGPKMIKARGGVFGQIEN